VGQSRVEEVAEPAEAEVPDESASAADAEPQSPEVQEEESVAQTTETEDAANTANAEPAAEETQPTTATTTADVAASGTVAFASDEVALNVKAAVATNCAGCHNAGLHGAAKADDADAWAALSDKGLNALTASVIDGKGKMPARAESRLSDEEIGQAVQLMVFNATGLTTMAAGAAVVAATDAASTETNSRHYLFSMSSGRCR